MTFNGPTGRNYYVRQGVSVVVHRHGDVRVRFKYITPILASSDYRQPRNVSIQEIQDESATLRETVTRHIR